MLIFYTAKAFFEYRCFNYIDLTKFTVCDNINDYVDSKDTFKTAFIAHGEYNIESDLEIINNASTYVFYFIDHPAWISYLNLEKFKNVHWVMPGSFHDRDLKHIFWNEWMQCITQHYQINSQFPNLLSQLTPFESKSKYFDACLGRPREHRTKVAKIIQDESLTDKMVHRYLGNDPPTSWCEPGLIETGHGYESTYLGLPVASYDIVPINLYNSTAFTIVAESICNNNLSFFTEKIAKPILGKRLFVVFSGYNYLKSLRKIGFQTFGDIIDESYDSIQNENQRFRAAMNQVKFLCNENQDVILEKIRPIVEFNFNLLMNTNWDKILTDQINKLLNDYSKIQLYSAV
jgi:hypothetical protein